MRTSNPALKDGTFDVAVSSGETTMTMYGTICKTFILTLFVFASAAWAWHTFPPAEQGPIEKLSDIRLPIESIPWVIGTLIGGFVIALVTCFVPRIAWFTAPIYALLEGVFIGTISVCFEGALPGVVILTVGLTTGTLFALLLAYTSGLIKATENFKLMVVAATGAICLVYLASIILGLFGVNMPLIHEAGIGGIIFSLVVVCVAALNLVLDFDFIEKGVERGAPSYMEWYAAFGLLVTLIWLYLEMLKLVAKVFLSKK